MDFWTQRNLYVLGGSPCAGKSTQAELLVEEFGFAYYKLDDFLDDFMARMAQDGNEHAAHVLANTPEENWMQPPEAMLESELMLYRDMFPYAMAALEALPQAHGIIAEGAGFMPGLVHGAGLGRGRYIAIVPSEAFQLREYAKRPWIGEIVGDTSDPKAAFSNWMQRDVRFARHVKAEAEALGYETLVVDGGRTVEEIYACVKHALGLEDVVRHPPALES